MNTFRQAPRLFHIGSKDKKDFYLLPKNLMDSVFNQLSGKQGNQIKLMSVLLGTAGDGSFAVSEKWICDRTGMDQSNYSRARKALIDRGWLRLENGKLYVNFNEFYKPADYAEDMSSEQGACDDNMIETCDNSMHNIERKNENNKIIPISENCQETEIQYTEEDHKVDYSWIDDQFRYEEYMLECVAASKAKEREEKQQNDNFDLDSILASMCEVEIVDSSYYKYMDTSITADDFEEYEEWEEYIPYIRNKGFNDQYYRDMIVEYIRKYGKAHRQEINTLLWDKLPDVLTDDQKRAKITTLLTSLRKKEIIKTDSKNQQLAHWILVDGENYNKIKK